MRALLRYDRPPLTYEERQMLRMLVSEASRQKLRDESARAHFGGSRRDYDLLYGGDAELRKLKSERGRGSHCCCGYSSFNYTNEKIAASFKQ